MSELWKDIKMIEEMNEELTEEVAELRAENEELQDQIDALNERD